MTSRFKDHILGPGTHASRPTASGVPEAALYECTTHGLIYKNVAGTWVTFGALIPPGGTTGQALIKNSGTDLDVGWGSGGGGGGSSYPPGSADKPPVSPNAKDDEFDGTSSVTWTSTPTAPASWDINTTRANHAYLKSGSGSAYVGKTQAVPGSYPFTMRAKFASTGNGANNRRGGIVLGPSSPTGTSNVWYMGGTFVSGLGGAIQERIKATFAGTYVNDNGVYPLIGWWGPYYIKVTVNSATSVDCWVSVDGFSWIVIEAGANPGFTPGVMGIALTADGSATECYCDFFRVT